MSISPKERGLVHWRQVLTLVLAVRSGGECLSKHGDLRGGFPYSQLVGQNKLSRSSMGIGPGAPGAVMLRGSLYFTNESALG